MNAFVFPFQWRELSRAVEWLNEREEISHTVTSDDFLSWWQQGEIELCYDWGNKSLVVPEFEAFAGFNEGYNWSFYVAGEVPRISVKPYGSNEEYNVVTAPHGTPDGPYELACDLTIGGLVIPRAEMEKAYRLLTTVPGNAPAPASTEIVTSKHCRFIVSALRCLGLTDADFKGSIPKLRQKLAALRLEESYRDDKTLSDWLTKAGVR